MFFANFFSKNPNSTSIYTPTAEHIQEADKNPFYKLTETIALRIRTNTTNPLYEILLHNYVEINFWLQ